MAKKSPPRKKTSRKRKSPSKSQKSRRSSKRFSNWVSNKYITSGLLFFLLLCVIYIIYLDLRITSRFEGRLWSLPSHVYARPLELYVDKTLSAQQFEFELELLNYQRTDNIPTKPGQYRQWSNKHFELITRDFQFSDGLQKHQALRVDFSYGKIRGLYNLYGHEPIALARLEPAMIAGIYPAKLEDRELIKLENIPDYLVLTLLAVEDRRFYKHWGVDPRSIARALLANISAGGTVQGGSTITQQLVKNLFLTPKRSLWRKFNEAIMSILLEMHYDKGLILETYINEVYLGQDGAQGIHGFALASRFYFDKPLNKLTKDQLALLVGIVKGASWYDPRRHPKRALQRRNQVLALMAEQDVINQQQLAIYKERPLGIAAKASRASNLYPAFIDLVKRQLKQDYKEEDLQSEGLRIFTTLDPLVQRSSETAVKKQIPLLEKQYSQTEQLQTAVIVASPENGEIQALVSDRDPRFPGFNRALDAVRQVGSLIKPAIYLSALSEGDKFNLASVLNDKPLHLKARNGDVWSPQNYDKEFTGDIPLYKALMLSRNVPTVRLGLDVGLAKIVNTLENLGIERSVPPYPSMTLGAFDLTPIEIANMYQTLAGKGFNIPLRAIREVINNEGAPLTRYPLKLKQTINEDAVYLINHVLHRVTKQGTAKRLGQALPAKVAGKTGTTDDLRDSWFAGYSEDKLAVVWLGRDDNQSTGLTGASGALKIWLDIMKQIPLQDITIELPAGMETAWIDSESGGLSKKACVGAVELPFISGTTPTQRAECKSRSFLDRLKGFFD